MGCLAVLLIGTAGLVLSFQGVRFGKSPVSDAMLAAEFERLNVRSAPLEGVSQRKNERRFQGREPHRRPSPGQRNARSSSVVGVLDSKGSVSISGKVRAVHAVDKRTTSVGNRSSPVSQPVLIPRVIVDKYRYMGDVKELMNSARSATVIRQGQSALRLAWVKPTSPLTKYLGLQGGDYILSINGYSVSRENGLELYQQLKDASHFDVQIERGGRLIERRFILR